MGEAKRRKQLDQDYGKVPSLSSQGQQQKHIESIMQELSQQFSQEIKDIAAAESIIEPYESYCDAISAWIEKRLAIYQADDRSLIASSIMTCYAEIAMKYESSPLLIKLFFDVLKPLLAPEKQQRIEAIANKITVEMAG
ncbi:MAG: hypothetical protein AAFQ41_11805 [Cyanobacteria bacterium J06623_7]